MRIGVPFYATKLEQMPSASEFAAAEATLFHREDLETASWKLTWSNIKEAAEVFGCSNVAFHFPFNNCDYVSDKFVFTRLQESFQRASDLGLAGVVVHASQVRTIKEWLSASEELVSRRKAVAEQLERIVSSSSSFTRETFLALENMPVIGNYGLEVDPTYVYPEDFIELDGTSVGITWDFCHFMITLTVSELIAQKPEKAELFPFTRPTSLLRVAQLRERVRHWHFSAFQGLPLVSEGARSYEGTQPAHSTAEEPRYLSASEFMQRTNSHAICTLEIQEDDYSERINAHSTALWLEAVLEKMGAAANEQCTA